MLQAGKDDKFVEQKLTESVYRSHNFNIIPPIIGIIIADQYGNTITVFEYDANNDDKYGPIKSYLSKDHENFLEIDLVSMYLSSLRFLPDRLT